MATRGRSGCGVAVAAVLAEPGSAEDRCASRITGQLRRLVVRGRSHADLQTVGAAEGGWQLLGNDSVWLQFDGAVASDGSTYALGTTSGLPINLEECSGCGISGWGWEDDGWGARNRNGVTLRFPQGGFRRSACRSARTACRSIRSCCRPCSIERRVRGRQRTTRPSCRTHSSPLGVVTTAFSAAARSVRPL